MPVNISQKSINIFVPELIITITVHLLLFNITTFNFNAPISKPNTPITFLGAILGPLEIGKVERQNYFSPRIPIVFSAQNQKPLSRTITAPAKPSLSQNVDNEHKTFFKSPPNPDKLEQKKEIPMDIPTQKSRDMSLPTTYQRLKL